MVKDNAFSPTGNEAKMSAFTTPIILHAGSQKQKQKAHAGEDERRQSLV